MSPILTISHAEQVGDYTLLLSFSNGETRRFDFSGEMQRGICHKLRDPDYFRRFTLDPFSVDWNNEIGFAPEYLYEKGEPV